jgi:hypothetical protein
MKDCKRNKENLVAFVCGEITDEERLRLNSHIEECPSCRNEIEELTKIIAEADSYKSEIEEVMAAVDWDSLPAQISERAFQEKRSPRRSLRLDSIWGYLFQPRMKPIYVGLLFGLLLGSALTFIALNTSILDRGRGEVFLVSHETLDKVELELARQETIDYLEESQYLLLDFLQSPPEDPAAFWRSEYASSAARSLLSRKRYINPKLDKFQMAKAKAICDQIEYLFYELAQISPELSLEELERIKDLIEDRQIMLKIKLLKKELGENAI